VGCRPGRRPVGRGDSSIADIKTANEAQSEASAASRQLKVLEDIAVFDARTDDHQEALEGVVRLVAEAMDCEVCSLYSYDSQTATLSLAATVGLPARSIGRVSMGRGEGLVGLVVEQNDVVTAEDALTHKRFKFFPELGEEKYHGFLGVPVGDGDAILGVLVLQARRRRKFGEDDIRLLRAVGGQVRGVMLNAHLTDRLQREEAEREVYRRNMVRAIRRLEAYEQARKKPGTARRDHSFVRLTGQAASPGSASAKPTSCNRRPTSTESKPARATIPPLRSGDSRTRLRAVVKTWKSRVSACASLCPKWAARSTRRYEWSSKTAHSRGGSEIT
jgi:phosphotransferase system enzyme I (PtsP)